MSEYRYECASLEGFVQRVVVLAQKGYTRFVQGRIAEGKDAARVDEKLLAKYDIRKTRRQRSYRRSLGFANVQYVRFERDFVLMVTYGDHRIGWPESNESLRDLRRTPIRAGGYAISLRPDGSVLRKGAHRLRCHVRMDGPVYRELKGYFVAEALRRSKDQIAAEIWSLPYEPYRPVYRQLAAIVWAVNERRKTAGLERVPLSCVRRHRRQPAHFPKRSVEENHGGEHHEQHEGRGHGTFGREAA